MKKIILILIGLAFMLNFSFAQENTQVDPNSQENKTDFRQRLLFGLKTGVNYSNVYNTQGEKFDANPIFGIAAGVFVSVPIGKYLGFQPEILFSQHGFKATGMILENSYKFTRTTSYLELPLLFSFKPSPFLSILAGPQYSYLLKQNDVFANATTSIAQEQEFVNDNIRRNTFCFIGGADINLNHFVIGARVGWDLLNNNGDGTSTTPRYKNYWYQFTFGYRFYR